MSHFRSATCLNVIILKHDKVKVCYFIKSFLSGIILPKLLTYHANFFFKKKISPNGMFVFMVEFAF